ncbi:MAG: hypothetical protein QXO15_03315 [Nitrososphaerota archaeon]
MAQTLIPTEVAELINLVAERYGYYFGKRLIQSELMRETKEERKTIKEIGKKISEKMSEYLEKGVDVREDICSLQGELARVRAELAQKSAPYYEKLRPLNKALSYLDKEVIPKAIERVTGKKVTPVTQVSDYLLKAIKS